MVLIADGESVFRYVYMVKLRMTDDDWQGWDGNGRSDMEAQCFKRKCSLQ